MTNRLELNWKLDGFVDEQRYYCSETLIDPENLPVPKSILSSEARAYIDNAVEVNKTYHVCLGSVRGNTEKLSGVITVSTNLILYTALYPLTLDAKDTVTAEQFTLSNATISVDGLYLTGASGSYATKADSAATTLGGGDFTIEIEFKSDRALGSAEVLVDNYVGSNTSWQLMLDGAGRATFYNNGYLFTSSKSYLDGQYHHYAVVRKGVITKAIIDGVVVAQFSMATQNLTTLTNFTLGAQSNNKSYRFKGWLRNLKICRQALYGF